jgi:hypothetical protein
MSTTPSEGTYLAPSGKSLINEEFMQFSKVFGTFRLACIVATVLMFSAVPSSAQKKETQKKDISQSEATAGGITPGDTRGFPVTITRPGSYRLTSNLRIMDPDVNAIDITAPNVTIDLNGFAILGPGGDGTGVGISAFQTQVTVLNGSIVGMGEGMSLNASLCRIEASVCLVARARVFWQGKRVC